MPSQVRSLVRSVFPAPQAGPDDRADGALLSLFLAHRDAEAFAVLVRRHGPLVRAVCRGILRNPADADDAFQATFLVLVRKADTIRDKTAVGAWLCGVAGRVSRKLRDATRTTAALPEDIPEPPATGMDFDTRAVLEDEVARLPERYRLVVQACYVTGHTTTEAAARLGWAKGTVLTRLAWARKRLRARLGARGVSLAGGAFGTLLGRPAAVAVSRQVVESLTRTALAVVAGEAVAGAASERAYSVSEGVIRAMTMNKLKWVGGAVLAAAVLAGVGVGRWTAEAHGEPGGQAKGAKKAAPLQPPINETPPRTDPLAPPAAVPGNRDPLVGEPISPLPNPVPFRNEAPVPSSNMIPPPALPTVPASVGKTFTISRPVGTWTREVANESQGTVRITAKFDEDRLTLRVSGTVGKDTIETVIDADYSITRESVVFGVVTGYDMTASAATDAVSTDDPTDQPFAFRFRVDNGVLTIKDFRMPGMKDRDGYTDVFAGRFSTAKEEPGVTVPSPAKPKMLPTRRSAPQNIPPTHVPGPVGPNIGGPPSAFPTAPGGPSVSY